LNDNSDPKDSNHKPSATSEFEGINSNEVNNSELKAAERTSPPPAPNFRSQLEQTQSRPPTGQTNFGQQPNATFGQIPPPPRPQQSFSNRQQSQHEQAFQGQSFQGQNGYYPNGQYSYPPGYAQPQTTNTKSIVALILGILSIVVPYIGIIIGIIGIIFSALSLKELGQKPEKGRGLAVAGLVLSIIGTVIYFLLILLISLALFSFSNSSYYY